MKKVIKLTESDLARIVKRVLKEQQSQAPAQGNNQGGTQGGAPGRRYQISDFVDNWALPKDTVIPVANFVKTYRNFTRGLGVQNNSIWAGYDTYMSGTGGKQENAANNALCKVFNNNIIGPSWKKGATDEVQLFYAPPVKFICVGREGYWTGVKFVQINQDDANIIDQGKTEEEPKYNSPENKHLIAQS